MKKYRNLIFLTLVITVISAILCGCAAQALDSNSNISAESCTSSEKADTVDKESSSVDEFTTTSRSELTASRDAETELRDLEELINRFKDREEIYYYEFSGADDELMCKYYDNPEIEEIYSKIKHDSIGV